MKHANDNHTGLRFLSVCSGIEAASVAWHPLGWKAVAFSEIEKFPSAVLKHHYPDVPNLGDFTKIDTKALGRVDILAGGTPCFTAGHLVLTERGYAPIESITVGDKVVTHKGRLRTVVRIGNEVKEVGVMSGVGMCEPITCTADHPFLAVEWRNQNTKRKNVYAKVEHCGRPDWVAASNMPGKQWCQLTTHANDNRQADSAKFGVKTAMYVAGMYLGDGWIRRVGGKNKKSVVLGINPRKYEKLQAVIGNVVHTVSRERTIVRVSIHDTAFAEWLESEFAHYSHLKNVPAWVMGHEFRAEFLRGFLDADGHVTKSGKVSVSTTSRSLAYGISDLLAAEGYVSSVSFVATPDTCVIEGRTCNQKDYYQIRAYPLRISRKARVRHGMVLRAVSGFAPSGSDTVFNIEVEEDHSYVVQGAIVHNCQAFSVAGLRQSLADVRGNLSLEFVRLAHELAANNGLRNVVWENVVGVLSTKDNAFGCFLAGLVGADSAIEPPRRGKWARHGMVSGPKGRAAWAVKDGQFFGVAQRRRRVLVVADFGNGADPAAVLFEPESMFRDSPPSREAGKSITHPVAPSLVSSGRGIERTGDTRGQDPVVAVLRGHSDYGPGLPSVRAKGGDCAGGSEALVFAPEIARCDATREGSSQDYETTTMVAVAGTLCKDSFSGGMGGRPEGATAGHLVAHAIQAGALRTNPNSGPDGVGVQEGVAYTLEARAEVQAVCVTGDVAHTLKAEGADASEDGTGRGTPIVAFDCKGTQVAFTTDGTMPTLRSMGHSGSHQNGGGHAAVAFTTEQTPKFSQECALTLTKQSPTGGGQIQSVLTYAPEVSGTIKSGTKNSGLPNGAEEADKMVVTSAVRRLTPRECERLQGFQWLCDPTYPGAWRDDAGRWWSPDYTDIPWRGKPNSPDGPRYKALGNSWAVPKFVWLGKRIQQFMPALAAVALKEAA